MTLTNASTPATAREAAAETLRKFTEHSPEYLQHVANGTIKLPTDRHAFAVLGAFQREPEAVGRDLLLVGYDDLDCAAWTTPPLTSVRQPFDELGRISVRLAIDAIYSRPARSEKVQPQLVVRETA